MDVRRLRILRELDRRGTLAAVAQAMGYTPSAISQQLTQLEREAGVPLLERIGRGVRLTAAAKVLVGHAERLQEQLELAEADMAAASQGLVGTIRVSMFQSAAHALTSGLLRSLASSAPDLRLELHVLEPEVALPALVTGDLDVVVAEEYPGHPRVRSHDLHRTHLLHDPIHLVVPRHHPARRIEDLGDDVWVMEPPGTTARVWSQSVCRAAGIEPRVQFESTDLLFHLRLVADGHAVALVPNLAARGSRGPVRLEPLEGSASRTVYVAVRRGAGNHPAISKLRHALAETVDRHAAGGPGRSR